MHEVEKREAIECNLVITGTEQIGKVDLNNDPLGIGHMQSDEQVVEYLFKNILQVEDVEVNKIERITVSKSEDSNRSNPNLMIVKTGSPYQKQSAEECKETCKQRAMRASVHKQGHDQNQT